MRWHMRDVIIDKNQMHSKLEKIYRITDKISCGCPIGCNFCEDRETLMLLPFEDEFMNIHLEDDNEMFLRNENGFCYQPKGFKCSKLHDSGICTVHKKRPFDCRSFPVVPYFSLENKNGIDYYLADKYCPILNDISRDFLRTTMDCWSSVVEFLPLDWKRLYNNLNHDCLKTNIPNPAAAKKNSLTNFKQEEL